MVVAKVVEEMAVDLAVEVKVAGKEVVVMEAEMAEVVMAEDWVEEVKVED